MTRRRIDLAQVAPWFVEAPSQGQAKTGLVEALFPRHAGPIHLEFGCGYGLFLRDLAALQPDEAFLGVEHDRGAALRTARKLMLAAADNARVVVGDAFWVLRGLFQEGMVGNVYVNFPDPWPKRRHATRRYIRQPFVEELHRKMARGHTVYLATDVLSYAEEMVVLFNAHPGFVSGVANGGYTHIKPTRVYSKYEQEFLAQGLSVYYLAYEAC